MKKEPKACYVCQSIHNIEEHHVFFGPNRSMSEKHKLKVNLCIYHHRNHTAGVHFNKEFDLQLKQRFQKIFEAANGHEQFMQVFGRNYL